MFPTLFSPSCVVGVSVIHCQCTSKRIGALDGNAYSTAITEKLSWLRTLLVLEGLFVAVQPVK